MEFVSQGAKQLTGYTPGELMLDNKIAYGDLIHADDRGMVWKKVQDALKKGSHFRIEYRIITKDNKEKWVWERGIAVRSGNKKIETLEGYITDITDWKQSDNSRKQTEERFRVALQNRDIIVATADRDLRYTWIYNPHPDFKPEKIIGKSDFELSDNEGARKLTRLKQKVIDTGKSIRDEVTFPLSDGEHTYDMLLEPIRDNDKKIKGLTTASFDITGYKKNEESLKNNERYLRAVIATSPVAIHGIDTQSRVILWNESSEKILGWEEKEIMGKKLPIVPEDKWNEHLEFRKRVESGESFENIEVIRRKKDGTLFTGKLSATPIKDEKNQVTGIIATLEDITERKNAEEALQQSEKKFRSVLESMELIGLMLDKRGHISFANDYLLKLTGWEKEDIIDKNWFDHFIPEDFREEILDVFNKTLQKAEFPTTIENRILTKTGHTRIIKWNNTVFFDKDHKPLTITSIGEDVTDQRRMEKELIAHREHLEELVAERTRDLEEKNQQLERFNKLFVGREFRIKELKNKVRALEEELKKWRNSV